MYSALPAACCTPSAGCRLHSSCSSLSHSHERSPACPHWSLPLLPDPRSQPTRVLPHRACRITQPRRSGRLERSPGGSRWVRCTFYTHAATSSTARAACLPDPSCLHAWGGCGPAAQVMHMYACLSLPMHTASQPACLPWPVPHAWPAQMHHGPGCNTATALVALHAQRMRTHACTLSGDSQSSMPCQPASLPATASPTCLASTDAP